MTVGHPFARPSFRSVAAFRPFDPPVSHDLLSCLSTLLAHSFPVSSSLDSTTDEGNPHPNDESKNHRHHQDRHYQSEAHFNKSNAHNLAEERSDDSQDCVVRGSVIRLLSDQPRILFRIQMWLLRVSAVQPRLIQASPCYAVQH